MKEIKVYVDELPKSCVGCKYFAEHRRQCNLELCIEWNEVKFKFNDCPLIDIKTHDRELVKEVCEKIARNVRVVKIRKEWHAIETDLRAVLDQIEKDFEK